MKNKYVIIAIAFLSIFFQACQEAQLSDPVIYECNLSLDDQSNNHPNAASLQAELDKITELLPGVVASVQNSEGVMWSGASGMADIPNAVDMQACHKLMVGSISKVFTATLIMQLVDEGIVNLEDPLSDWLEQSLIADIENANDVNIEQLLNHTTGITDYLGIPHHFDAINIPHYKLTQTEKMELIHGKKAEFEPGDRHEYSNSNYVLLGLVVEKARGMTLWDATETYISSPLGLRNCIMGTHDQPLPSGTARPYIYSGGGKFYDIYQNSVADAATGDGGMSCAMQDLILFFDALRDGILVKPETYQMMNDRRAVVNEENEDYYGLGLEIEKSDDNGFVIGHTGSTSSYNSFLFYFPDYDGTIAMSLNGRRDSGEVYSLIGDVIRNMVDVGVKP